MFNTCWCAKIIQIEKKKLTRLSFLLLIKLCPSNFLLSMVLRCTKQFFSYVEITLDLTSCLTGRKKIKKRYSLQNIASLCFSAYQLLYFIVGNIITPYAFRLALLNCPFAAINVQRCVKYTQQLHVPPLRFNTGNPNAGSA